MNSLSLSKDQRAHLLEMCRILFPKYKEIIFGKKYWPNTDYIWMYDNDGSLVEIHWFELCSVNLVKAILYEGCNYWDICEEHESYLLGISREDIHPVDYLYEKFLELKYE